MTEENLKGPDASGNALSCLKTIPPWVEGDDIFTAPDGSEYKDKSFELVALAAASLDAANIPHVLWGNYMMGVFAVPVMGEGFDFVVEDDSMEDAYETLQKAGFKPCPNEDCEFGRLYSTTPTPHKHLHIARSTRLGLWRKSDVLWRLPNLADVDGKTIILASDREKLHVSPIPNRRGPFPEDLHPVRIPSVYQVYQALLLLGTKHQDTFNGYYMNGVWWILEYCVETGIFDTNHLTGDYRAFAEGVLQGDTQARRAAYHGIGLEHTKVRSLVGGERTSQEKGDKPKQRRNVVCLLEIE